MLTSVGKHNPRPMPRRRSRRRRRFHQRLLPRSSLARRWLLVSVLVVLTVTVALVWARWDADKALQAAKTKARDKTADYLNGVPTTD